MKFFLGVMTGATLAYFYDPNRGKRRRAMLRAKALSYKNHTLLYGGKRLRDMKNRSRGLVYEVSHLLKENDNFEVDDEILIQRVRSAFGKNVSHTKPIEVYASAGIVKLSGPILAKEVKNVIACLSKVPGVLEVINDLDVYETSEGIPDLQGSGPVYLQN